MLNDFLRSKLEITVKKVDKLFQATCSMFPESIGIGETEEDAIYDLADLIAYRMGNSVHKALLDAVRNGSVKRVKEPKFTKKSRAIREVLQKKKEKEESKEDKEPKVEQKAKFVLDLDMEEIIPYPPIGKLGMIVMGFGPKRSIFDEIDTARYEEYSISGGILLGVPVSFN